MKPQFIRIAEVLAPVRGVVIGGVAMAAHGSAHLTEDFDLLYDRESDNLKVLAGALEPYHPTLRGAPADLPFRWDWLTLRAGVNFTLDTDLGPLDLLGQAPGAPPFAALLEAALAVELGTATVRVAALEHLIAMKEAAGRPKDQLHLLELRALQQLRPWPPEG